MNSVLMAILRLFGLVAESGSHCSSDSAPNKSCTIEEARGEDMSRASYLSQVPTDYLLLELRRRRVEAKAASLMLQDTGLFVTLDEEG